LAGDSTMSRFFAIGYFAGTDTSVSTRRNGSV